MRGTLPRFGRKSRYREHVLAPPRWAFLVWLCGCGRFQFDPLASDAGATSGDARDGAASVCTALFCDGFEMDLTPWGTVTGPGTSDVQTTQVHGGTKALTVSVSDNPEFRALYRNLPFGGLPAVYVRAWFYVPSGTAFGHVDLLEFEASTGEGITAYVSQETFALFTDVNGMFANSGGMLPRDRWFCVELEVDVSDTVGSVRLKVDGTIITQLTALDTLPPVGFEHIVTGLAYTGPQQFGPASQTLDDIVVDDAPIGCSP